MTAVLKPQALLHRNVLTVDQLMDVGRILVEEFAALEDLGRILNKDQERNPEFEARFNGMLRSQAAWFRWGGLDVSELMLLGFVKEGAEEFRDSGWLNYGAQRFVVLLIGSVATGLSESMLRVMWSEGVNTRDARLVERVIVALDRCGVDPSLSARKAAVALRASEVEATDVLIRVAQRLRARVAGNARYVASWGAGSSSKPLVEEDEF